MPVAGCRFPCGVLGLFPEVQIIILGKPKTQLGILIILLPLVMNGRFHWVTEKIGFNSHLSAWCLIGKRTILGFNRLPFFFRHIAGCNSCDHSGFCSFGGFSCFSGFSSISDFLHLNRQYRVVLGF